MNFDDPVVQQYLMSLVAVLIGVSGWLLPFKWNLLRLRARYGKYVSERTNHAIPKVIGTLLIIGGVLVAVGTAQVGSFEP